MDLIRSAAAVSAAVGERRDAGATVGLVPTMGALHPGHDSLIDLARVTSDFVVVSIFVNPRQFGPGEDLSRYPRDEAADLERCRTHGSDLVWAPPVDEMYPPGIDLTAPDPGPRGSVVRGRRASGPFRGGADGGPPAAFGGGAQRGLSR